MPTHLKKMVRSRMAKTGESYATALRYVRLRGAKRDVRLAEGRRVEKSEKPVLPGTFRIRYAGAIRRDPAINAYFCIGGEPFCYVVRHPEYVHLGFCEGVSLSDPARILRGKGKFMRHVRLTPDETFPSAALADLVAQSARRIRGYQAADPGGAKEVRDARR